MIKESYNLISQKHISVYNVKLSVLNCGKTLLLCKTLFLICPYPPDKLTASTLSLSKFRIGWPHLDTPNHMYDLCKVSSLVSISLQKNIRHWLISPRDTDDQRILSCDSMRDYFDLIIKTLRVKLNLCFVKN